MFIGNKYCKAVVELLVVPNQIILPMNMKKKF